jgi:hypothetical protein
MNAVCGANTLPAVFAAPAGALRHTSQAEPQQKLRFAPIELGTFVNMWLSP